MVKTDKFIKLGIAAENIAIGQRVEYLPSTGLVRLAREKETIVTIHPDGSMTEKAVNKIDGEKEEFE